MGSDKVINTIAVYCSLMAIPVNLGLSEQIEDILRIYEKVLGKEPGIESYSSEMEFKTYVNEVISEIQQIRDNEPSCNE